MASNVGKLIQSARKNAKLTQTELANKIGGGITAADIGKAERGEAQFTLVLLRKIAKVTGVTQVSLVNAAKESSKLASSTVSKKTKPATTPTPNNYLRNPGFEDTAMSMWKIENIGNVTEELYRSGVDFDAKSGNALLRFYDPEYIEFRIEQTVSGLAYGKYNFSLYIQGGDALEQNMYIYVILNGEVYATTEMRVTRWQEWQHPCINNIPVTKGKVTVGAYIQASGINPWGKMDDWMLKKSK